MSVDLTKDKWPERMGTDDPVAGIYITHAEYDFARHRVEMFEELVAGLENIVAGCVHPDIAIRRVMLDLAPIRDLLARAKGDKTP